MLDFLQSAQPAFAAGWIVNSLSGGAIGSCSIVCTLRDAMTLAASGDTITFSISGTITVTNALPTVNGLLTIDGTGQNITISGGGTTGIMLVNSTGTLSIVDLTLSNGNSDLGGAINVASGKLYVRKCLKSS